MSIKLKKVVEGENEYGDGRTVITSKRKWGRGLFSQ